MTPQA